MTDHLEMIERLERQNMNPDLPKSQREANELRIQWLGWLHRDKPVHKPTNGTDVILEACKDPNYRCTPRLMLQN